MSAENSKMLVFYVFSLNPPIVLSKLFNDTQYKGKVQKKKHKKKLTNVSLYVCMSAEKSKMLVFFYVFSPNSSLKDNFQNRGFMLDIHTYKLTFVSFFMFFFAPSPCCVLKTVLETRKYFINKHHSC